MLQCNSLIGTTFCENGISFVKPIGTATGWDRNRYWGWDEKGINLEITENGKELGIIS